LAAWSVFRRKNYLFTKGNFGGLGDQSFSSRQTDQCYLSGMNTIHEGQDV
jgi:hypothetical protein